jgi:lipopolysaccharide export system protein LptA
MAEGRKLGAYRAGAPGALLAGFVLALGLAGAPLFAGLAPTAAGAAETAPPMPAAKPAKSKAAAKPAPAGPLGGFATDPNEPIEIEADNLEVEDKRQTATFIGNVVAVQGATRLRSDRLQASYAPGANGGKTQVREIYATGKVHVTSKDDQSADGDWARYVVAERRIVMGDTVLLRQGKNVIRGTKLFIDLNSGRSRVAGGSEAGTEKPGANGRVKALFQPSQEPKK